MDPFGGSCAGGLLSVSRWRLPPWLGESDFESVGAVWPGARFVVGAVGDTGNLPTLVTLRFVGGAGRGGAGGTALGAIGHCSNSTLI
jgi:hypothetical protein